MRKVDNFEPFENYLQEKFEVGDDNFIEAPWNFDSKILKMPNENGTYEYENSVSLHRALDKLDRTMASDIRLWTYLTHIHFWNYMQKRRSVQNYFSEVE